MKDNVSCDDSKYREYVKNFFKKEFDIKLIDTPDSYFHIELPNKSTDHRSFISGKYNFDLIPYDYYESLTFVEVETVKENNPIFNKSKDTFNVLASKYWKYCICASKPGKIVYVQIDKDLNPTGKLAIVNSIDIHRNCDLNNYKVLPSSVNYTGQCAIYEIKKGNFIEYWDVNKEMKKLSVSRLIKVTNDTREKYWNKFQNYAINDSYLMDYDVLRFQGYEDTYPFKETNFEYLVDVNDARKHAFKFNQFRGFTLIRAENVKTVGEQIQVERNTINKCGSKDLNMIIKANDKIRSTWDEMKHNKYKVLRDLVDIDAEYYLFQAYAEEPPYKEMKNKVYKVKRYSVLFEDLDEDQYNWYIDVSEVMTYGELIDYKNN